MKRPAIKGKSERCIVPKGAYPGGYWQIHFWHGGKEINASSGYPLEWLKAPNAATGDPGLVREASAAVFEMLPRTRASRAEFVLKLAEMRRKRDGKNIPEDLHGYIDYHVERIKKMRQYESVRDQMRAWTKALPNRPLSAVTQADLVRVRESWWEDDYAGNTINCRTDYIGRMFERAIMDGLITVNPKRFLRPYPANQCTRILLPDEEPYLFDELPAWAIPPTRLSLLTGLRQENAAFLKRAWVRRDIGPFGTIIIPGPEHKGGRIAKARGGKPRDCEIPMGAETLALVTPRVTTLKHEYVFSGPHGAMSQESLKDAFHDAWTRAAAKIAKSRGVSPSTIERVRFHDLRHTFATRYLLAGGSPHALIATGLWSTIKELERYTNLNRDHIQADFAKVRIAQAEWA